ncbi:hypothetical protein FNU76_18500 [Chitinimonas arctica]|uniref:PNPLA domain-containing protein n=1 Tax=Chitinimonas arctica TaxID=2594795 RepID=A0A516SJ39_9NEIS|nr:patatin-like phospholipase family protein [Chitinimonas arctica]QDQ28175.1 hypothetical protein FNU76_18500 [Chitinimonas arctica]
MHSSSQLPPLISPWQKVVDHSIGDTDNWSSAVTIDTAGDIHRGGWLRNLLTFLHILPTEHDPIQTSQQLEKMLAAFLEKEMNSLLHEFKEEIDQSTEMAAKAIDLKCAQAENIAKCVKKFTSPLQSNNREPAIARNPTGKDIAKAHIKALKILHCAREALLECTDLRSQLVISPDLKKIGVIKPAPEIDKFAFDGGGQKGLVMLVFSKIINAFKTLVGIEHISGLSVGSLYGSALALGMPIEAMERLMAMNMSKFMGRGKLDNTTVGKIAALFTTDSANGSPASPACEGTPAQDIKPACVALPPAGESPPEFSLHGHGWHAAEQLYWLIAEVHKQTAANNIQALLKSPGNLSHEQVNTLKEIAGNIKTEDYLVTFGDLAKLHEIAPKYFKHLSVIAYNDTEKCDKIWSSTDPKSLNVPIAQAVRASMAIPGVFKSVKLDGITYVDGCVGNGGSNAARAFISPPSEVKYDAQGKRLEETIGSKEMADLSSTLAISFSKGIPTLAQQFGNGIRKIKLRRKLCGLLVHKGFGTAAGTGMQLTRKMASNGILMHPGELSSIKFNPSETQKAHALAQAEIRFLEQLRSNLLWSKDRAVHYSYDLTSSDFKTMTPADLEAYKNGLSDLLKDWDALKLTNTAVTATELSRIKIELQNHLTEVQAEIPKSLLRVQPRMALTHFPMVASAA